MSSPGLVLSCFPGIGLLDRGFEDEGFTVVRGPDLLWGGDVHRFRAPRDVFDGVIGGPPCQRFSPLANINRARYGEDSLAPNLIPEFERIVGEAQPRWFLMENVPTAPAPVVEPYFVRNYTLNNRWLGAVQNRERRFSFGTPEGTRLYIRESVFEPVDFEPAVTSTSGGRRARLVVDKNGRARGNQGLADHARLRGRSVARMAELQGLPADFLSEAPFTEDGKRLVIGNGVPYPMARAVAAAVKRALSERQEERVA